jgi:hypothetical protein
MVLLLGHGVPQTKPSSVSLAVRSFVVIFERLLLLLPYYDDARGLSSLSTTLSACIYYPHMPSSSLLIGVARSFSEIWRGVACFLLGICIRSRATCARLAVMNESDKTHSFVGAIFGFSLDYFLHFTKPRRTKKCDNKDECVSVNSNIVVLGGASRQEPAILLYPESLVVKLG